MANLKDLRNRIGSVKSTKKITSAMKMVAASKLRQAQMRAENARPYAQKMDMLMARLMTEIGDKRSKISLLDGTGQSQKQLFIVVSGDRGLCGGFNAQILKMARTSINDARFGGKKIKIICVGRKVHEGLKKDFKNDTIATYPLDADTKTAEIITKRVVRLYEQGDYDEVHIIYNQFKNAMSQIPIQTQVIPYHVSEKLLEMFKRQEQNQLEQDGRAGLGWYSFEPDVQSVLQQIVPQQIATRVFQILLEAAAGEQAARMTAMDNATRNAGDMIDDLTMQYNRERQAVITREITEIVSGADAL